MSAFDDAWYDSVAQNPSATSEILTNYVQNACLGILSGRPRKIDRRIVEPCAVEDAIAAFAVLGKFIRLPVSGGVDWVLDITEFKWLWKFMALEVCANLCHASSAWALSLETFI